jgi:2-C-methyl-D-erythritol 2,4-cyclodiphosphate synthase
MRVGTGYDVHRLAQHRKLVLGGVEIPFDRGLAGHSDADVLTHAIMDALLGAAGLPDIGVHFPNNDPQYAGISSLELLRRVSALLAGQGFLVGNIDATVIAERPKIAIFIEQMKTNIGTALDIPSARIGIKATTNEGLGSLGRGEGIAAMAVALLHENDGE